jgi:uncharacterized protein with FMN-binding domain
MSSRTVIYALAGTATGALLIIGAKGSSQGGGTVVDTVTTTRRADISGVPAAIGKPLIGDYKVDGSVVVTPFGPVQVEAVFRDTKLTGITMLRTPDQHAFSVQLNKYATPILRTETLKAQDAVIDVVSGATYTSDAYAKSLQAALDDAATGNHN